MNHVEDLKCNFKKNRLVMQFSLRDLDSVDNVFFKILIKFNSPRANVLSNIQPKTNFVHSDNSHQCDLLKKWTQRWCIHFSFNQESNERSPFKPVIGATHTL